MATGASSSFHNGEMIVQDNLYRVVNACEGEQKCYETEMAKTYVQHDCM